MIFAVANIGLEACDLEEIFGFHIEVFPQFPCHRISMFRLP